MRKQAKTKRYFEKIDFNQTYPNSLTTADPARAKTPMVLDNDLLAIQAAVSSITDASNIALLERGVHFNFDSNGNLVLF